MKKTIRTLSMVMMALAMALCFLFAGLTFVRADVLAEVDQSAIDTAAVYIGPLDNFDVNETGIKFTAKIKKTDYYALTGGVDAIGNNEVHLGVEVSRANADGSYTILPNAHYTVDTAGTLQTYNVGGVELEDYFMYSFSVKYNLERIFGENFDANDATIAKNINFMYADELCIRPFYQVISEVDGAGPRVYGEYGASRSMVHVAMAEYADVNSTLSPEEKELFISKYVSNIEEETAIEVYADGRTDIALDSSIETYTIGTSAKVVARADGRIDASALKDYAYNDTFQLFGYTADRKVYTYNATYKGVEGIEATKVYDDILYDVTSGKYFLNNTALENEEVVALYGLDNEKLSAEEINNLPLGESVNLKVVTNKGVYNAVNFKPYTMVFENTAESRELMVQTFYTADYKLDIPHEEQRHEITGVYALAENIYFDYNVYDQDGNVVEGKYNTKEAFYNPLTDHTVDEVKTYYDPNIFRATFDGRGYALNNVLRYNVSYQSMFGVAGDGAVIKNLAINDSYKVTASSITQGKSYESLLFYKAESAEAKLTLENVYIYITYTAGQATGSLLYYDSSTTNKLEMTNVLIVANNVYEGTKLNSAFVSYNKTLAAGSSANNVYIVTNSSRGNFYLTAADAANSSNYAFYKLEKVDDAYDYTTTIEQKLAEFKAAGKDFSGFDVEYWTIIDGIPSWNTINTVAKIKDSTLKAQKEISSTTAGEKFIISVQENSEEIAVGEYQVAISGDVATIDGKVITINDEAYGSEKITITYKGSVLAVFDITVDTRHYVGFDKEVLLSKEGGYLTLGVHNIGAPSEVLYKGQNILEKGVINTAKIEEDFAYGVEIEEANNVGLIYITTEEGRYILTNVKWYDGAFDQEHKQNLLDTFNNYTGTLTGNYVLAENITFSETDVNERFTCLDNRVFDATFDGRGYTINNFGLPEANKHGAFGSRPGNNAVIKNLGINRIFIGLNQSATSFQSVLISGSGVTEGSSTLTMKNVYVYRYLTTATSENDYLFVYNGTASSNIVWNFENVIVEYDIDPSVAAADRVNNIINSNAKQGTQTYTYFTNCNTKSAKLPGVKQYNSADTLENRRTELVKLYGNDFNDTNFSSDYWAIVNGYPMWKTCSTIATMANAPTEVVTEAGKTFEVTAIENGLNDVTDNLVLELSGDEVVTISGKEITTLANVEGTATITVTYKDKLIATFNIKVNTLPVVSINGASVENVTSTTAGETFTVTAIASGLDVAVTLEKEDVNNVINISGNVVTVNEKVKGSATVIVNVAGEEVARFDITVDTRVAEDYNEAVLLSKADGKLYFNNTSLAGAEITAVAYNGNSIFDGEKVDASAFTVNSDEPYALSIVTTTDMKYNLTNVMVYDAVFENTTASRKDLLEVLNATSANYKQNGYFVLAENITFASGETTGSSDYPFIGTFDGRGYTLNNVYTDTYWGLLGRGANVATLKNFAIFGITPSIEYMGLFSDRANAGEVFNFENVYIYYNSTAADSRHLSFHAYNTNDGTGTWNLENVIFELEFTTTPTSTYSAKFLKSTAGEANNSYFIMNGPNYSTSAKFTSGNYKAYGGTTYTNTEEIYAAMAADGNNYRSFSSQYWTIVNGVPVWNTCSTVALFADAQGESVDEITQSGTYTVTVLEKGELATTGITTECESDFVSCDGANIVVEGAGRKFSTEIVVYFNEVELARVDVVIDEREATVINEEVIFSKIDNRIFTTGTALGTDLAEEGVTITSIKYNETELIVDGAVDLTALAEVAGNTQLVDVVVETSSENLYELDNVMVYDGAFDNTKASRIALIDEFSGSSRSGSGDNSGAKRVTGYYVLVDNITFDISNLPMTAGEPYDSTGAEYELFGNREDSYHNVFAATLDGRGHTLNDLYFIDTNLFGDMGDGATFKNIAFNNINKVTRKGSSSTGRYFEVTGSTGSAAKFFQNIESKDACLTMENVYINDPVAEQEWMSLLFYNPIIEQTEGVYVDEGTGESIPVYYQEFYIAKLNFKNVIIVNNAGPILSGSNCRDYVGIEDPDFKAGAGPAYPEVLDTDSLKDVYVISTAAIVRNLKDPVANSSGDRFIRENSVEDMIAKNYDYTSFSSAYWTVAEGGIPTWKTLPVAAE